MLWAFVNRCDYMAYFGGNLIFYRHLILKATSWIDSYIDLFCFITQYRSCFLFINAAPKNMYVGVFWSNKAFVFTFAMEISCDESVRVKSLTVSGTLTELYG